jgi:hypothetical protein
MKIFKIIGNWFDKNIGWFFINGMKREDWDKQLKEKYDKTSDTI